jgi:drug/metabolite transporter (DMT)-like permease
MALISGTLAYFLFIRGERSIEAGEAGLFAYLQPLFTVPLAILWLGERVTPAFIIGATIVGIGVYVAEKKNH